MLLRNFLIAAILFWAMLWGFSQWQPLLRHTSTSRPTVSLVPALNPANWLPDRNTVAERVAPSTLPTRTVPLPSYPLSWIGSGTPQLTMTLKFGPDSLSHVSTQITALPGSIREPANHRDTDWLVDLLDANGNILLTRRVRDPRGIHDNERASHALGFASHAAITSLRLPFPRQAKQAQLRPATSAAATLQLSGFSGSKLTMVMATTR